MVTSGWIMSFAWEMKANSWTVIIPGTVTTVIIVRIWVSSVDGQRLSLLAQWKKKGKFESWEKSMLEELKSAMKDNGVCCIK